MKSLIARPILALCGALFLALIVGIPFSNLVEASANRIYGFPGEDIFSDYLLGVMWSALLGFSILFWPVRQEDRPMLLYAWVVKLLMAMVIMLIYDAHYGIDLDGYFTPNWPLTGPKFGEGSSNVRQLSALVLSFTGRSLYADRVIFGMFGLIGLYLCYRAAILYTKKEVPKIFYCFVYFPTALLWSTLLGKDPVCLLGVGLYSYGMMRFLVGGKSLTSMTIAVLGIGIASLIRPWYGTIMAVPIFTALLLGRGRWFVRMLLLPAIVLGIGFAYRSMQSALALETTEQFFEFQSRSAKAFEIGASSFRGQEISDAQDAAMGAPVAIVTALFRPFIFECTSMFQLMFGLDNTFLVVLLVMAIRRTKIRELADPVIAWLGTYVVLWAFFYGYVTYNFGALSRYKIQILPALISLLLLLARRRTSSLVRKGIPETAAGEATFQL